MRSLDDIEPERYEQGESPAWCFEPTRRDFFRVLGGGLLVGVALDVDAVAGAGPPERRPGGEAVPQPLAAWLQVRGDGAVIVYTGKVEMGQGIRTSLAQLVAEELRVKVASVRMVMGDTDLVPHDRGTHGSQSTPQMGPQLRRAAATARSMLVARAATLWSADAHALELREGRVVERPGKRSVGIGELAQALGRVAMVDAEPALSGPEQWTLAGKSIGKVDARAVVTGRHRYVSDLQLPGLRHGKVLRAPSFGAKLRSVDLSRVRKMAGVLAVHDGEFVGVVASDPHAAGLALAAIDAKWDETPQVGSDALFEHLESHPVEQQGWGGRREDVAGTVDKTMRAAKHRLEARYTLPYLAHAPLEPRSAVAHWVGGRALVWVGTQHPFPVRDDVAKAFALDASRVRVRVPDTGSGYGGKHSAEVAIEAARLAKASGTPVKLVWTREEELTWAYFRPAGVMRLRSGVDSRGRITAWEHINFNSGSSSLATPYDIANRKVVFQPCASPVRQGSYRALAATANTFARESHMDEIAAKLGLDPLELRLRHLTDARLRAVLDAAVLRFGWAQRERKPGRGAGLALGVEKGGYVCTVAEVAVDATRALQVLRVVTAFECGAIVNPDNLRNQVEGAVVMGLGGALFEAIELAAGSVGNARFSRYRVPRFVDLPPMETVLLDRRDLPSAGAGETPIVAIAPALANAVFAATGERIRDLPLAPGGKLR